MRQSLQHLAFSLISLAVCGLVYPAASWAQEREEYVTTGEVTTILQDPLFAIEGKEASINLTEFPPGWIGGRHYHTGDVFVYVLEGIFIVDVDGEERQTFRRGEVYHEALNRVMQARNFSTTERTKILVFQVGDKGEPPMIKAR